VIPHSLTLALLSIHDQSGGESLIDRIRELRLPPYALICISMERANLPRRRDSIMISNLYRGSGLSADSLEPDLNWCDLHQRSRKNPQLTLQTPVFIDGKEILQQGGAECISEAFHTGRGLDRVEPPYGRRLLCPSMMALGRERARAG
jgi:hypothetical protein